MTQHAVSLIKEFLFPRRYEGDSIPPLDGGLTPNDALDTLDPVAAGPIADPDDLVCGTDGDLYVTTGHTLVRLSGENLARREAVASFDGVAGALARTPDGAFLVGVAGRGLIRVDAEGRQEVVVDHADGEPVRCVTSVAVSDDGVIHLTDGSVRYHGRDWVRDLMEQNRCGRLLTHDASRGTRVVARNLAYPAGVCPAADGDGVLVTEAWSHRISRFDADGRPTTLRRNLPGYPSRITPAGGGGYWLAVFARRTLLVEFMLTERDFVTEMMRTIAPDYWVRPALRTLDSGLEPVQGGQIRKLGVIKPWAPPRSYGLVVRVDEDGNPVSSLHSRSGGRRHGVTAVREHGGTLYIAAQGGNQVLVAREGAR